MAKRFIPTYTKNDVYQITPEFLKETGTDALILDLDDTLVEHNCTDFPATLSGWIKTMRDSNISLVILSNNKKKRIAPLAAQLNIRFIHRGLKPMTVGYSRALVALGVPKERTLAVGDQLFTDIWGANRAGIRSLLVNPVSDKATFFIRLKRRLEKRLTRGTV